MSVDGIPDQKFFNKFCKAHQQWGNFNLDSLLDNGSLSMISVKIPGCDHCTSCQNHLAVRRQLRRAKALVYLQPLSRGSAEGGGREYKHDFFEF